MGQTEVKTAAKILADEGESLKVGGYGVVFGGRDLVGDTFTPQTDLWLDKLSPTPPVLFDHGGDEMLKRQVVGRVVKTKVDSFGLWIEAKLDANKQYLDAIRRLVEKGALGWSSGAVGHLVERAKGGKLVSWAIAEFSLTATPCEPRTLGVQAMKTLAELDTTLEFLIDAKSYRVQQRDGQYCVVGPTGTLGRHGTRTDALAQQRALYANEGKAMDPTELDDGAFAFIEADGTSRPKRHFPHHRPDGTVDEELLAAALEDAGENKDLGPRVLAHLKRHTEAVDGIDDAHALEWQADGAPATLLRTSMKLHDLAKAIVPDLIALKTLDIDTKSQMRLRGDKVEVLKQLVADMQAVISSAEYIDRGEDGKALLDLYAVNFNLLEMEVALSHA